MIIARIDYDHITRVVGRYMECVSWTSGGTGDSKETIVNLIRNWWWLVLSIPFWIAGSTSDSLCLATDPKGVSDNATSFK